MCDFRRDVPMPHFLTVDGTLIHQYVVTKAPTLTANEKKLRASHGVPHITSIAGKQAQHCSYTVADYPGGRGRPESGNRRGAPGSTEHSPVV